MDIWYMFACIGLDWVKPTTGTLAYIATNNWLTNAGAKKLRTKIAKEARIDHLIDFGDFKVFRDAGIQTMILIARKDASEKKYKFDYRRLVIHQPSLQDAQDLLERRQTQSARYLKVTFDRTKEPTAPLTFASNDVEQLLDKIAAVRNFSLNARDEIAQGIVAPQDRLNRKGQVRLGSRFSVGQGVFVISDAERRKLHLNKDERQLLKPYYTTTQLRRYFGDPANESWIIYTDSTFSDKHALDVMPNLKRHLDQFAPVITSHNRPYGLHRARDEKFFKGDKIVAVRKCVRPTFTYTSFPCYVSQTFNVIKSDRVDLMFLTGLLNSRLVRIWLMHRGKRQGHHFQVDKEPLLGIPLHLPGRARQRKIAKLVQKVSSLYERQGDEALTDAQRVRLEHAISGVEEAIDEQIETLYGLDTADRDHLAALDETPHGAAEESTDAASVDEVDDDS